MPALSATTPRPRPLPAGRAVVRRASRDLAGPPRAHGPVARPCGGHPVSDDPCRACSGASRQRPDEQPADEPPRALSALPPATRSVAPPGAAMDHLPAASGHRRSVPRSISGIDRRPKIGSDGFGSWHCNRGYGSEVGPSPPEPSTVCCLSNSSVRQSDGARSKAHSSSEEGHEPWRLCRIRPHCRFELIGASPPQASPAR